MGDPNFHDPGQSPEATGTPPPKPAMELTDDEKLWAMLAHMSYLLTFVVGASCIAPLVIWVLKKDSSAFIEDQAKEALNFQLSALIVTLIAAATCVGLVVVPVVLVAGIVYGITGGMAANRGEVYRYPYTFRMIN